METGRDERHQLPVGSGRNSRPVEQLVNIFLFLVKIFLDTYDTVPQMCNFYWLSNGLYYTLLLEMYSQFISSDSFYWRNKGSRIGRRPGRRPSGRHHQASSKIFLEHILKEI